ncbi:MAG: bifunctional enoyl-CoA hydratase/phosphate acetyltransferase [Chloroflexia bacterium]|nr:bifunctional enoyl-CoA hydratase/phosphate acetyltransferase [Chloroflexia bacterium]
MQIRNFAQLREQAKEAGPRTVVIAAAQDHEALLAASDAERRGLANFILVGDQAAIEEVAASYEVDISSMAIFDEPDRQLAAHKAMELVSEEKAHCAMKGKIFTADFLKAALNPAVGLRTAKLLTHVAVFDIPGFDKLILLSDAGVLVAPTLEQKVHIVQNAIDVASRLGVETPRVAVLAAAEMVNPKIPSTMDAASLSKMADRGQIYGGVVDGPLALDNAISVEAARIKGIQGQVAGRADILIAPDLEAGNALAKAIIYFAHSDMAGVVVGARMPLILPSRADTHEAKMMSIVLGVLMSTKRPV